MRRPSLIIHVAACNHPRRPHHNPWKASKRATSLARAATRKTCRGEEARDSGWPPGVVGRRLPGGVTLQRGGAARGADGHGWRHRRHSTHGAIAQLSRCSSGERKRGAAGRSSEDSLPSHGPAEERGLLVRDAWPGEGSRSGAMFF